MSQQQRIRSTSRMQRTPRWRSGFMLDTSGAGPLIRAVRRKEQLDVLNIMSGMQEGDF